MTTAPTPYRAIADRRDAAWRSLRLHSTTSRTDDPAAQAELEMRLRDYLDREAQHDAVRRAVEAQAGSPYQPSAPWSFFADVARSSVDRGAAARLKAHQAAVEDQDLLEGRSTMSSYGGMVVPQYLTQLARPASRTDRPLADLLAQRLPDQGASVMLAKVATAAAGEVQATEGTALSGTSPTTTAVTVPVSTVAIRTVLSYQMLERGSADFVIASELVAAHDALVEQQLVNGSGASGEPTGLLNTGSANAVTFTSATPTLAEFADVVAEAISECVANRGLSPDTLVMHPRRYAWNASRSEANNLGFGPPRPGAPPQVSASFLGLDVVLSAGVPTTLNTNRDAAIVGRRADWYYAESPLVASLDSNYTGSAIATVGYRLHRYVAVDGSRWASSTSIITGTGMDEVAA